MQNCLHQYFISLSLLFIQSTFPDLCQVRPLLKAEVLGILAAEFLNARCLSCYPIKQVKEL